MSTEYIELGESREDEAGKRSDISLKENNPPYVM
jgi:hypothetical protein